MEKIQTKNYGIKTVLFKEQIKGMKLYYSQVSIVVAGTRFRIDGIINSNKKEIIPFGEMNLLKGIRVINESTFIIDYISLVGECGVCSDICGSKLYQVIDNNAILLCSSNAGMMNIDENNIIGVNYLNFDLVAADNSLTHQIEEYKYDINNKQIIESKITWPNEYLGDSRIKRF